MVALEGGKILGNLFTFNFGRGELITHLEIHIYNSNDRIPLLIYMTEEQLPTMGGVLILTIAIFLSILKVDPPQAV